ncbi:protein FAM184B isoform X2 [Hemicordylus capensis]|uniref:protein FAM184B isoform X2 n=1 Tax=Hemicordylus capensis TaxID=884348 RepID=UPI00230484B5|nr:protein FAM184B isoform X2 [Hemicordylus capensis]
MASGINKVHQAGTCNGSSKATSHCSSSEEGDQEMHMKMCKKIAQLTKVIYALNTKNDEHETSIQALEEAHQEKIRHILAETRETVLQYKSKVEEEQELRKRIQTLEEALEKYRRLKGEASAELTVYKKQVEESESEIEAKCTDNIIFLPKEMLNMKLDFENRVQTSDQESDGLLNECWAFEGKRLDNKRKLRETYSMEMQAVVSETVTLKQENQKLAEEYAKQASQLQASHEREKETWKKVMQQSVADSCREWQQKEIEQRKTYEAREAASQQQIRKLEADLEAKGQRIYELKKHSQKLKEKIQGLEMQLKEAQQLTVASKSMVKTLEEELVIAKERLLLQEDEIRQKTESMETALNFQSKARGEVDELKNPSLPLQQVLSTKKDQGNQGGRDSQLREAAGSEKEAVKQQHREELRKIKQESDEEKMRLKEQLVKGLEDLVKKHTLEIKSVQASMDVERKKLQKEVQTQLEELKKKHENEIKQLQKEKEAVNGKLQDCSLEVLRLEDFIRQNQDIPKYTEFLKSHARKTYERQQESLQQVQQKDISRHHKEKAKCREQQTAPLAFRKEEKARLDSGDALKKEDRQMLASFQKEKTKEIQALQEEWYYQKTELQAQVTQLKQTLDQQANAFREALKEQTLQSSKEREKLLQDLQDTIKESQAIKAQLEASHQKAINLLEKSKTQELKKAEEHWKKEYKDSFKVQQQTHSLEIQALGEKAREELQSELGKIQKQQSQLIESLRVELSEQRASCITHKEENEQLQVELNNLMSIKKQQEGSYQNQIKSLKDEMEKCQNEISGLKKENSLLKDTMDLLSVEGELQKQTSAQLQERVNQHRRLLEEELKVKHKKELDILKQDYHKEIQNMVSDFSNSQALLHAKIVSLENEVKELDDKPRKREPGLEDVHLTGCLQDKLNEKDEMIKELMDGRKLQHALMPGTEPRRNRSFSFNTNPSTCLTPIAKKKKIDEAPSRIVSVPNLASYAKSFLSGDLRPKRNPPQITKSTSLDQNPGCVRVCYPSVQALDTHPAPRLQNETSKPKDAQKQDPRHQEWFTKYFSF